MIQLTDEIIKGSFDELGLDEKFFPFFEKEVIGSFNQSWLSLPVDEVSSESLEKEKRELSIILDKAKRSIIYFTEIEKGHSRDWAATFAKQHFDEEECYKVFAAYNSIDDKNKREKELEIYVNHISDDDIFRDRFKSLIHKGLFFENERVVNYTDAYHQCVKNGKSVIYAHAFADEVSKDHYGVDKNHVADIYAEAYEMAIKHGMNDICARRFGNYYTETCCNDCWWTSINEFIKKYHEDWQKELYLYLTNKDYKKRFVCDMPSHMTDMMRDALYIKTLQQASCEELELF